MKQRNFVIWAPDFDETSGGSIALHYLCKKLNDAGCRSFIWPGSKRIKREKFDNNVLYNRHILGILNVLNNYKVEREFKFNPKMRSPIARSKHLKNSIIVYPEIVSGNPLSSPRVVRWFLNKPGYFTGEVNFGDDELYFFYSKQFDDAAINPNSENQLRLTWIRDDIYCQRNFGTRRGSCYILRKGKDRTDIIIPVGSINIEECDHKEKSDVFNKVEYFYSFDPYTMYTAYAAMCGCIPVVVPHQDISKEMWRPVESDRYGIAYGIDDKTWAVETREKMISNFQSDKMDEKNILGDFINKCQDFFS